MKKIIPIIMILLVGSCTLFNRGPDPYNIAEWVKKPPIGIKLTILYYYEDSEENEYTNEYILNHIYEDDTIFTVYYTFYNDSFDSDLYVGDDTLFYTVNHKTNKIWGNIRNPQIHGQNGVIILRTPIKNDYIFDSNYDPFTTYRIDNIDTIYTTQDDTLINVIKIWDSFRMRYYSLNYIFLIYSVPHSEGSLEIILMDVE